MSEGSKPGPDEAAYEDTVRFRAKRELRKRMRTLRAALPAGAVADRSEKIRQNVLAMPEWAAARTVALFASTPDEVQTAALIADARAQGKQVVLPAVVEGREALVWRAPWDGGAERALSPGAYGILEPGEDAPEADPAAIDLVLVPALAADVRGHRVGYGAGWYDRTLPQSPRAVAVVVVFDFQLVAEVPERVGDVTAHWLVTDRRTLRAEPGA